MDSFLKRIPIPGEQILLIAPPPMIRGEWACDETLIRSSVELAEAYRELAGHHGISFADAGEWGVELSYDGVHFTEAGHRAFAHGLYEYLQAKEEW